MEYANKATTEPSFACGSRVRWSLTFGLTTMKTDAIAQVLIDAAERLCVFPGTQSFEYIYRAASEVNWDKTRRCLYSPEPREWSYFNWFQQIASVVESEYGYTLTTGPETQWSNISAELRSDIENWIKERSEPSVPNPRSPSALGFGGR